jgi:hypothetical protein
MTVRDGREHRTAGRSDHIQACSIWASHSSDYEMHHVTSQEISIVTVTVVIKLLRCIYLLRSKVVLVLNHKCVWRSGGTAARFLNLGTRRRYVVKFPSTTLYPRRKSFSSTSNRRLGGPQSRSECGEGEKQPLPSPSPCRCTDCPVFCGCHSLDQCFSTAGPRPGTGPGINYTGPRSDKG